MGRRKKPKFERMIEEELPGEKKITVEDFEEEKTKSQIIHRPVIQCELCGAINSFVQIEGVRHYPAFLQANARCKRCGHRAKIRLE